MIFIERQRDAQTYTFIINQFLTSAEPRFQQEFPLFPEMTAIAWSTANQPTSISESVFTILKRLLLENATCVPSSEKIPQTSLISIIPN